MTEGQVIGLRLAEPERYISRAELADLMGVSVRVVDQWRKEGMPAESWGLRVVRFKASVAIQWVRSRQDEAA